MKFLKGFLKVLGGIFAFGLTIVYIMFLFTITTISTSKNILKVENIKAYISTIDFLSLPANDVLKESYGVDKTLKDVLEEELEKKGVDKKITNEVIVSEELKDFISNFIIKYTDYVLYDKAKPIITENEINKVISVELIEQTLEIKFTENQKTEFNNFIKATIAEINKELPDKEVLINNNDANELLTNFKLLLSNNAMHFMIISLIVIFFLIALCCWSFTKPLIWLGIANIITGFFISATYIIQKFALKTYTNSEGAIDKILITTADSIFKRFLISGLIILAIGIVFIIVPSIIKKIINNKKDKKISTTIIDE